MDEIAEAGAAPTAAAARNAAATEAAATEPATTEPATTEPATTEPATTEVVEIAQGRLRGSVVAGVHRFLGIPYAAPPFGSRRLLPPEPPEGWNGVWDATRLGPEPPQIGPPLPEDATARHFTGRDCLNLNLWTPDPGATARRRPTTELGSHRTGSSA